MASGGGGGSFGYQNQQPVMQGYGTGAFPGMDKGQGLMPCGQDDGPASYQVPSRGSFNIEYGRGVPLDVDSRQQQTDAGGMGFNNQFGGYQQPQQQMQSGMAPINSNGPPQAGIGGDQQLLQLLQQHLGSSAGAQTEPGTNPAQGNFQGPYGNDFNGQQNFDPSTLPPGGQQFGGACNVADIDTMGYSRFRNDPQSRVSVQQFGGGMNDMNDSFSADDPFPAGGMGGPMDLRPGSMQGKGVAPMGMPSFAQGGKGGMDPPMHIEQGAGIDSLNFDEMPAGGSYMSAGDVGRGCGGRMGMVGGMGMGGRGGCGLQPRGVGNRDNFANMPLNRGGCGASCGGGCGGFDDRFGAPRVDDMRGFNDLPFGQDAGFGPGSDAMDDIGLRHEQRGFKGGHQFGCGGRAPRGGMMGGNDLGQPGGADLFDSGKGRLMNNQMDSGFANKSGGPPDMMRRNCGDPPNSGYQNNMMGGNCGGGCRGGQFMDSGGRPSNDGMMDRGMGGLDQGCGGRGKGKGYRDLDSFGSGGGAGFSRGPQGGAMGRNFDNDLLGGSGPRSGPPRSGGGFTGGNGGNPMNLDRFDNAGPRKGGGGMHNNFSEGGFGGCNPMQRGGKGGRDGPPFGCKGGKDGGGKKSGKGKDGGKNRDGKGGKKGGDRDLLSGLGDSKGTANKKGGKDSYLQSKPLISPTMTPGQVQQPSGAPICPTAAPTTEKADTDKPSAKGEDGKGKRGGKGGKGFKGKDGFDFSSMAAWGPAVWWNLDDQTCWDFKKGTCKRGDECRWEHK